MEFKKALNLDDYREAPPETDYPAFNPEQNETEKMFSGDAIFTDIDGTLTDNSGKLSQEAIDNIKRFTENGGTFVPVTGRARFESVCDIVQALDLPYVIINNGAEIFNGQGERIYGNELSDEEIHQTFDIAEKHGLVWMQNKYDEATDEEHLYSNFTPESEQAMLDVGIVDTVHNEEGRIGITAKQASADEVMAIPGQNYKIQMMSPDFNAVKAAYDEFRANNIPCMLNMQSKKTGQFHWVEVIRGTKHAAIQNLINNELSNISEIITMGDGGNDISMLQAEYTNKNGEPVENLSVSVRNASESVIDATKATTLDKFNAPMTNLELESYGVAVSGMVDYFENKHKMDAEFNKGEELKERAKKAGIILPGMEEYDEALDELDDAA